MARPPRIEVPGGLYHVVARGNQRRHVFRRTSDYEAYLARLHHYQERYGFILYAYVLMPNHVHLLLEPAEVSLSRVMQGVQQSYAAYFNRAYRTIGHVFQGRYKAILCDRDRYLLALVRYLHLNPVRSQLARSPKDWRWSSHRNYLGQQDMPRVATDRVLGQFHTKPGLAVRRYLDFLEQPGAAEHHPGYYQTLEHRFLGDERFAEQMGRRSHHELPAFRIAVSLNDVGHVVATAFNTTVAHLRAPGRERQAAMVRAIVAHIAQVLGGIRLVEVARAFCRDQVTITLGVQHLRRRLRGDIQLARQVNQLMALLRRGRAKKYRITNV